MAKVEQWSSMANVWSEVKTPLRPQKSEIDFFNAQISKNFTKETALNVLILGVTPELYNLEWPIDTKISAVDKSQDMVYSLWLGQDQNAFCDNWLTFNGSLESYDVILCDGGFHLIDYPTEQLQLVKNIYRLLKKKGLVFFRFFIPPVKKEGLNEIFEDLLNAKIVNMSMLKLRLLFALQKNSYTGVQLKSVWDVLNERVLNLCDLHDRLGWSEEELATVNPYQNNETKYHLSSWEEIMELFSIFKHIETSVITKNCPMTIFQKIH